MVYVGRELCSVDLDAGSQEVIDSLYENGVKFLGDYILCFSTPESIIFAHKEEIDNDIVDILSELNIPENIEYLDYFDEYADKIGEKLLEIYGGKKSKYFEMVLDYVYDYHMNGDR
jgi:hypothetical protein